MDSDGIVSKKDGERPRPPAQVEGERIEVARVDVDIAERAEQPAHVRARDEIRMRRRRSFRVLVVSSAKMRGGRFPATPDAPKGGRRSEPDLPERTLVVEHHDGLAAGL